MAPNPHSPIIVGEQYELAEQLVSGYGDGLIRGLLPQPGYQTALLSMLGYNIKGEAVCMDDFNPNKVAYSTYNEPYNVVQESQSSANVSAAHCAGASQTEQDAAGFYRGPDNSYGSPTTGHPQPSLNISRTQPPGPSSHRLPEVSCFAPHQGTNGCPVRVSIRSAFDLETTPIPTISLSFGAKLVLGYVQRTTSTSAAFMYNVLAYAPHINEITSSIPQVELRLNLQGGTGQSLGSVYVGQFEYTAGLQQHEIAQKPSKKRKVSAEAIDAAPGRSPYSTTNRVLPMYTPSPQPARTDVASQRRGSYGGCQHLQRSRQAYSVPATLAPQTLMQPLGPQRSVWGPNAMTQFGCSSGLPARSQIMAQSTSEDTPMLVRKREKSSPTSNLVDDFGRPYAPGPTAVIKINGDVNSMAYNWTSEQRAESRRLVMFTRSQNGSVVTTDFATATRRDRPTNSNCISCIWWPARQKCYVTSVEIILLLEALIGYKFDTPEKNRIRRNLEGFQPETMSKSKGRQDLEEFFKIIMKFENPKPRNIEKDVKVYQWELLPHCLMKVFSKYEAQWIARTLSVPRSSLSYGSPPIFDRSISNGTVQGAHTPTMRTNTLSSHSMSNRLDGTPRSASDYSLSTVTSSYTNASPYIPNADPYPSSNTYIQPGADPACDYDLPKRAKRPRASTTNTVMYSQHDAAVSFNDMPRSFSDHGNSRLPSVSEACEQATPGMNQNLLDSRGSWQFSQYANAEYGDGQRGMVHAQTGG